MTRRLGEILVDAKVLSEESLSEGLARQRGNGQRLGAALIDLGLVDEQTLVAALSQQFELPVAHLRHHHADERAVARLPESVARSLTVAPMRLTPLGLEVAASDRLNPKALAQLEGAVGTQILVQLATVDDIDHALDRSYPSSGRHRGKDPDRAECPGDIGSRREDNRMVRSG